MSLVKKKNWYLDYLLIIVGTGLMALAINSVFDATGLVTGGFSGVQDQRIFLCKKSSGWRDIPLDLACHSAGVEYCRR